MSRPRGFTLIEILVVISIIIVLISIVLPALQRAKGRAALMQCSGRVTSMGKALSMYADDTRGKLPRSQCDASPLQPGSEPSFIKYYDAYKWANKDGEYWCQLGCLYKSGHIDSGMTFYCPAITDWRTMYQQNCGPKGAWGEAPFDPNDPGSFTRYIYWPQSKTKCTAEQSTHGSYQGDTGNYLEGFPTTATSMTDLNQQKAIIADYCFHSQSSGSWRFNALFPDGHVVVSTLPTWQDRGMWCAVDQWPAGVVEISGGRYVWLDSVEQSRNTESPVRISRFMFAIAP